MTIVERIYTLVRADINDMLDRAEDPEKVIKQLLLDMHSQLLQAKTHVALTILDDNVLYQRYQDSQSRAIRRTAAWPQRIHNWLPGTR